MKISDLAERSGISTHTLHYYEKNRALVRLVNAIINMVNIQI
ncbi:MerR family DNA-binding transcriptional regulator [Paraglaciecola sp.]|nr:MerR family DNA-binding transcriptional regulator [Paraglaciecola sp.]MDB4281948.1 MerR family DNA-binding transcriptional regulator [Paraglaciecola sp.]